MAASKVDYKKIKIHLTYRLITRKILSFSETQQQASPDNPCQNIVEKKVKKRYLN